MQQVLNLSFSTHYNSVVGLQPECCNQYRVQELFSVFVCRASRLVCPGYHTPPSFCFILYHLNFDKFPNLALHLPSLPVFVGKNSVISLQCRLRGTLRYIVVVLLDPLVWLSRLSYFVHLIISFLLLLQSKCAQDLRPPPHFLYILDWRATGP